MVIGKGLGLWPGLHRRARTMLYELSVSVIKVSFCFPNTYLPRPLHLLILGRHLQRPIPALEQGSPQIRYPHLPYAADRVNSIAFGYNFDGTKWVVPLSAIPCHARGIDCITSWDSRSVGGVNVTV